MGLTVGIQLPAVVDLNDALVNLRSFGHDCTNIAATRPYAMGWAPTPPLATVESLIATAQSLAAVSEYTLVQRAVPWARLCRVGKNFPTEPKARPTERSEAYRRPSARSAAHRRPAARGTRATQCA